MTVRVLFFGAARDAVGSQQIDFDLAPDSTAATARNQLIVAYPGLQDFGKSLLLAVNQEYAEPDSEVREGDELAVFPPVSGGSQKGSTAETRRLRTKRLENDDMSSSGSADVPSASDFARDFFELTTEPIDVGVIARRVILPECGATVTLDGYAREWTKGRRTLYLVYEAYAPMALSEMKRLAERAHAQFDIAHIGIVHRTGRLEIGETSVVIAVSAPHRRAAFEACAWAIHELKRTVPIWKKEVFADGEFWVEGSELPLGDC